MWYPERINTNASLYKAIADALERDINSGVLQSGDRLPPQRKLAEKVGVNLTTITRAYQEAQRRGLIETLKGDGTYVKHHSSEGLTENNQALGSSLRPVELGFVNPGVSDLRPLKRAIQTIGEKSIHHDIYGYVESQGLYRHRLIAAKWLEQYGFRNINVGQVVISAGATNALNCVLLSFFETGDCIATDPLTFSGFIHSAELHGIKLIPISADHEGMLPDALEGACAQHHIRGVYLMPNMQNPTALTMGDERKKALADVIKQHRLRLIEDDIFAFTNLESTSSISALIPQQSVFISGLSKALYPSLRVAYVKLPEQDVRLFVDALVHTVWMASPLNAEVMAELIESGDIYRATAKLRSVIATRQAIARQIFKAAIISNNPESMYLWVQLPEHWDGDAFERAALVQGVHVISATKFHVGTTPCPNAIRIALTTEPSEQRFTAAISKLAALCLETAYTEHAVM